MSHMQNCEKGPLQLAGQHTWASLWEQESLAVRWPQSLSSDHLTGEGNQLKCRTAQTRDH